ncbi:MAG: 30S ribosomal protein S1, partial [Chloroflexi bacterium]|nr:30S ribosomal protein S1 [Chloroflexota bacterium]
VVHEGQTLTLRVVKIDPEKRRIGLSLKKVASAEFLDSDWETSETGEADSAGDD